MKVVKTEDRKFKVGGDKEVVYTINGVSVQSLKNAQAKDNKGETQKSSK
jgi:hypothetical protein